MLLASLPFLQSLLPLPSFRNSSGLRQKWIQKICKCIFKTSFSWLWKIKLITKFVFHRNWYNHVCQLSKSLIISYFLQIRDKIPWHRKSRISTWNFCCGLAKTNLTSIHEDTVWFLALLIGLRIWHCHQLWCKSQMWPESWMLWLWYRLAATALIWPLAWEPPYAVGVALKKNICKWILEAVLWKCIW